MVEFKLSKERSEDMSYDGNMIRIEVNGLVILLWLEFIEVGLLEYLSREYVRR